MLGFSLVFIRTEKKVLSTALKVLRSHYTPTMCQNCLWLISDPTSSIKYKLYKIQSIISNVWIVWNPLQHCGMRVAKIASHSTAYHLSISSQNKKIFFSSNISIPIKVIEEKNAHSQSILWFFLSHLSKKKYIKFLK